MKRLASRFDVVAYAAPQEHLAVNAAERRGQPWRPDNVSAEETLPRRLRNRPAGAGGGYEVDEGLSRAPRSWSAHSLPIHHIASAGQPAQGIVVNPPARPGNRGKVCSLDRQSSSINDYPRLWKCLPHL